MQVENAQAEAGGKRTMAKRGSAKGARLHAHNLQVKEAARVLVPSECDVAIIGGGASGLATAVSLLLARPHTRVVIFEAGGELGAPILATGNGRCNISNVHLSSDAYNEPAFVQGVFGEDPLGDIERFFCSLGVSIQPAHDVFGNLYPSSQRAESVRVALAQWARFLGAVPATMRQVTKVESQGEAVHITYQELFRAPEKTAAPTRELVASQVVVACNVASACALLKNLNIKTVQPRPLLLPICPKEPYPFSGLDGVRAEAKLSVITQTGEVVFEQTGEILCNKNTISGICTLNASRMIQAQSTLQIALLPHLLEKDIVRLLPTEALGHTSVTREDLAQLIHPVLAERIVASGTFSPAKVASFVKHISFEVAGLSEASQPQVIRGGIAIQELDPKTLSVCTHPRIFATGDAINVDGPCGGYNLSWAWCSAFAVAKALARELDA